MPAHTATGTLSASGESTLASAPAAPRAPAQPQEIGAVVILAGIDAESLAAAGFSGVDCDSVFDAAGAYCLQSDRMADFSLAYKALNEAKARCVKPAVLAQGQSVVQGQRDLLTVEQAQGAVDDLREGAFSFMTTGLDADKLTKLRKIRTNKATWHISEPYLTVDRTDAHWLSLRGALAAQRYAARKGVELDQTPAAVIAAADGDETVAAAKSDFASNLPSVKQSWSTHTH
jgi:hypothetical protein